MSSISTVPPPLSQTIHIKEVQLQPPPQPVVNIVYDPEPVYESASQTNSSTTLNITV